MAYDPADLRLPPWLLRTLDALVDLRIPLGSNWSLGMTRPGIIYSGAWFGVWAAAFYSGNNLLYLCGAVLTAIMAAALIRAVRLLKQFPSISLPVLQAGDVTVIRQPMPAAADAAAVVDLFWSNAGGEFSLSARCSASDSLLNGRLKPGRRGLFALDRLQLSTTAPLGLYVLSLKRDDGGEMAVLPSPLPWAAASRSSTSAEHQRHSCFEGDEWSDLRDYMPGDPLSRIHWRKATGDARRWSVKRFQLPETPATERLLRVDLRLPAGSQEADFESLLGRAWFWIRQEVHDRGRLVLGQEYFELSDERQYRQLLRALAAARPEHGPAAGSGGMLLSLAEGE